MKYLLSLILLMVLSTAAIAEPVLDTITETKTDAAYGVTYTEERIVKLPQDQNKFYLSVIGSTSDPKYQAVLSWFNNVPELKSIKAQTHFNAVETTSAMYTERYAGSTPATPCIRMQAADGTVLYQSSGARIPMSGEALTKGINTECLRRWRNRHNDNAQPKPDVDPVPDTDPTPDVTPDVQPDVAPVDSEFPLLGTLASIAGGLFIGAGGMGVKSYRDKYKPVIKK